MERGAYDFDGAERLVVEFTFLMQGVTQDIDNNPSILLYIVLYQFYYQ